jgi:hypothetical protein
MNTMNTMPGFTADASLYKTDRRYSVAAGSAASSSIIVPQIPIGLCTKAAYYCTRGYQKWCDIEDRVCNVDV